MEKKEILDIPGNRENIRSLTAQKKDLVPFIGAGFSVPACPQWHLFLENVFNDIKENFLLPEDRQRYLRFKQEKNLEKMADLLVTKSGRQTFEEAMKTNFNKPSTPDKKKKSNSCTAPFQD